MSRAATASRASARSSITTVCAWSSPRQLRARSSNCGKRHIRLDWLPFPIRHLAWPALLRRPFVVRSSFMYTLGINAAFHDPAACLVQDGQVLAAAEEERFTHVKH